MKASDEFRKRLQYVTANNSQISDVFKDMFDLIDELSPKEPEKVWPYYGDKCYRLTGQGDIFEGSYDAGDELYISSCNMGMLFRTQEEAEACKTWLTSPITQARRRIEGLDGYDAVGEYCLYIDHSDEVRCALVKARDGGLRFVRRKQAEAALSTHEADIRLVLTGGS